MYTHTNLYLYNILTAYGENNLMSKCILTTFQKESKFEYVSCHLDIVHNQAFNSVSRAVVDFNVKQN